MSDYEDDEFDEDFEDENDGGDDSFFDYDTNNDLIDDDREDQDDIQPCRYCSSAYPINGRSRDRHGTCDYCYGLGMMPE